MFMTDRRWSSYYVYTLSNGKHNNNSIVLHPMFPGSVFASFLACTVHLIERPTEYDLLSFELFLFPLDPCILLLLFFPEWG